MKKIEDIDLEAMRRDVQPFVIDREESEKILLFREYLKQLEF